MTLPWQPGSPIVVRSVRDGRVRSVRTLTIVADSAELIAMYIGAGYPRKSPTGKRGGPRNRVMLVEDGGYNYSVWVDNGVLILYRPGDAHTTQFFGEVAAQRPHQWYIDLHEPLRRTPIGFDTHDHVLDAVVAADRASWAWKDEDEVTWHVAMGTAWLPPVEALRREGERAVARLTATHPPLYREWETWQPDPAWPIPAVPANWATIF